MEMEAFHGLIANLIVRVANPVYPPRFEGFFSKEELTLPIINEPSKTTIEYFDSKQTVYSVLFHAYYGDECAYNIPNFPRVLYTYICASHAIYK